MTERMGRFICIRIAGHVEEMPNSRNVLAKENN